MSDNPQYGDAASLALPEIHVVALTGRDALAFSQSQFMNDVAALADGDWQWSGWLEPKGRVKALFALLRLDAETVWLATTAAADTLAADLARFVFRSKVKIAPAAMRATGRLAAPQRAHGARADVAADRVELDLSGAAGARALVLSPQAGDDAPPSGSEAWWALDAAHGWPALPGVELSAWTPQQLSLQRLHAFSVKKGCYPGQEIVARTHFLGRAKRGLASFASARAVAGDAVVDETGREVGTVIARVGERTLAVLPLEHGVLLHDDQPIRELPLADGLER